MPSKSNKRMGRQRKPCAQTIYDPSRNHPIHIPNDLGSLYSRVSPKPFLHQLSSSSQLKRQTPSPLEKMSRFGKYPCWIYTRQSMAMSPSSTIVMSLLKICPSFPPRSFLDQMMPTISVGKVLVCWRNILLEQRYQTDQKRGGDGRKNGKEVHPQQHQHGSNSEMMKLPGLHDALAGSCPSLDKAC